MILSQKGQILRLTLLGLTALSTMAAPAPALHESLQPLAGYVGNWKWRWKTEHGEPREGQSTVQADPSGAFVVDRVSDLEDGKLTASELNIYFWRTEAKAVGGIGFTSSGDHGSSTVFIRGPHWTEQSSGYNADGILRTHVDQWNWISPDAGEYQETHIVHGGRAEPDDLKLRCERATNSTPSPTPQEHSSLGEHLKTLSPLLGQWEVSWTDSKGAPKKAHAQVQSEIGGAVLTGRIEEGEDGKLIYSELTVFYWRAEAKTLATISVDSTGRCREGNLYLRVDKWVSQLSGYDGEGKLQSGVAEYIWSDKDSLVYQGVHTFVAGEARPDSPKYRFQRLKQ